MVKTEEKKIGILFQTVGAATWKAQDPIAVVERRFVEKILNCQSIEHCASAAVTLTN